MPNAGDPATPRRSRSLRLVLAFERMALVLAGYLLLRSVFGPSLWPLSLCEPLLFWLCLPSFVLLPLALAVRRKPSIAAHAIAVAEFALLFGALFVPKRDASSDAQLSVMTWNIADDATREEDVEATLRASGVDLVLLTEVGGRQAERLSGALRDVYPERVLFGLGGSGYGLLSRHRIVAHELFRVASRRAYLDCRLDVAGRMVRVIGVHLPFPQILLGPFGSARTDIEGIAQRTRRGGSVLVLGDFNSTETMRELEPLREAGFRDAFRERGLGPGCTFPSAGRRYCLPLPPVVRIDAVWHTPDLACADCRVGPDGGSDHRPVTAAFVLGAR